MKYLIDKIIIVEGKEDASYLSSFIEAEYIITKQTINPVLLIVIAMAVTVALSHLYMWVTKKRKRMTA